MEFFSSHLTPDDIRFGLVGQITGEVSRARDMHPGNEHRLAALHKKVGDLSSALLESDGTEASDRRVLEECVKVGAMAVRIALEGDKAFAYKPQELPPGLGG